MNHESDDARGTPVLSYHHPSPAAAGRTPLWLFGALSLACLCAAFIIPSAKGGMSSPLMLLGALVCAINQIIVGRGHKRLEGKGTALAWGIWVLVLWAASLIPYRLHLQRGLNATPERANRVQCASRLRQICQSISLYAYSHKTWPESLAQVLAYGELRASDFVCPSSDAEAADGPTTQAVAAMLLDPKHCSYVYHRPAISLLVSPSLLEATVVVTERPDAHQAEGMNVLYADGHVEWHHAEAAQHILRELQAGRNPPRWGTTPPVTTPSSTQETGGRQ